MKPIKTNTSNRTYTGKGCEPLPVTAMQFKNGEVVLEACIEISENELQEIIKTHKIYISFVGENIIPFMLHTKSNTQ